MSGALDAKIERLYSLPLEEFTGARNELAKTLRGASQREDAARVAGLRKPSLSAWAVNQAVRAEPGLLEALLGAGGELRQAHRQAARGGGAGQLRSATDAERDAVDALASAARKAAGKRAGEPFMERVRETLHAASLDEGARDLVAAGRVVEDMRAVGLGPFVAESPRSGARSKPSRAKAPPAGPPPGERRRLEREVEVAGRAVAAAETRVENAREALDEARASLAEQRARLKRAQAAVRKANR